MPVGVGLRRFSDLARKSTRVLAVFDAFAALSTMIGASVWIYGWGRSPGFTLVAFAVLGGFPMLVFLYIQIWIFRFMGKRDVRLAFRSKSIDDIEQTLQ